jgi:hypothetical protein
MISTLMGDLLAVLAVELVPVEAVLAVLDELPLDEQPAITSVAAPTSARLPSNGLRMVIIDPHSPSPVWAEPNIDGLLGQVTIG